MAQVYEQGYYAKSIDYQETPPPPAFSEQEQAWVKERIRLLP
jgi:hypothetical protein